MATTSALEDRRLRRDVQETYIKVLDMVASNATRLGETVLWERNPSVSESSGEMDMQSQDKDAGLLEVRVVNLVANDRLHVSWLRMSCLICGRFWPIQTR